jgi:hypothetical protein
MVGQDISIVCENGEIPAYFSEPKVDNGPGVIIISAIFGVDDDTKKMCDKLAESGHPAMALNMFWKDEIDSGPLLLENYDRAIARAQAFSSFCRTKRAFPNPFWPSIFTRRRTTTRPMYGDHSKRSKARLLRSLQKRLL